MIRYDVINDPDPHTGEFAQVSFDEEQYEHMLGSLILSDTVDLTVDVVMFPSARNERGAERSDANFAWQTKTTEFINGVYRKIGLKSLQMPLPEPYDSLGAEQMHRRNPDEITVVLNTRDDEYNNRALAVQTYLWSVYANGLPTSQSWRNRLLFSQLTVPLIGGAAAGFGISEIPVGGSWLMGIAAGSLTMVGLLDGVQKLRTSGDPDFDNAITFARDYVASNEPVIRTLGPPYLPETPVQS